MKLFCITFLLLSFVLCGNAQTFDTLPGNRLVSVRAHYGFIIAHRPTVVHLQRRHVRSIEVELAKPLAGDRNWQQPYGLPLFSIAYQYFDLGNKDELGGGHFIAPRIIFPLNKNHWLRTSITAGVGLGYIEKHFDRYENYKNVAIGSHFNAVVSFSYQARISISRSTQLTAGIAFTHFSNGTIKPPNLGINVPTAHAGISTFLGRPLPRVMKSVAPAEKYWVHKVMAGAGVKGLEYDGGINIYAVSVLSYSLNRVVSHKSMINVGADAFHDRSLVRKLEMLNREEAHASTSFRLGVNAGYTLTAGKISLLLQNGIYIIDRYKKDGAIYTKLGVEYNISKSLYAAFHLKSHFGKADFFEYGIGYYFNRKGN